MGFPAPADVRAFLQNYGLDLKSTLTLQGTTAVGSAIVTGLDTTGLRPWMYVAGTGIQKNTQIASVDIVDPTNGQITLNAPATAAGSPTLTITYYSVLGDDWYTDVLNKEIIPIVNRMTRQSFNGIQTVTEYYDGTGSSVLSLRRRPIVALLNLSYTNVDSTLYYLSPMAMQVIADEGVLKAKANFNESTYSPVFWKGQKNLRVTYSYGWATCPDDVSQAIKYILASLALTQVANFTGGGNLSAQGYSRDFGKNGRYTDLRSSLVHRAYALLRNYASGAGS